jgi:TRAP-type C4-dicarboxylate transport system permease small subunit
MKKIIIGALLLVPTIAGAQELDNVRRLIESVRDIIDILIPLVAALALLYFFWGLAKFILNSGNEEAQTEGKNIMIWGIVALFVIVSVWGLVRFVGSALGINPSAVDQPIPGVGN